jgi:hypothetical protein
MDRERWLRCLRWLIRGLNKLPDDWKSGGNPNEGKKRLQTEHAGCPFIPEAMISRPRSSESGTETSDAMKPHGWASASAHCCLMISKLVNPNESLSLMSLRLGRGRLWNSQRPYPAEHNGGSYKVGVGGVFVLAFDVEA